jgi:hypothetical protein
MIISHAKRFVLFSPWKTASNTTLHRLKSYNETPYSLFYDQNRFLNRVVHRHLTCADFAVLPESRLGYFTGSFVRNPYDRLYSGFIQLTRAVQSQPGAEFSQAWVRELVMAQLNEVYGLLARAGFDFDRWVALLGEEHVYEIGRNSTLVAHPAHYWTHLGDEQFVDFIGRTESFEEDFAQFCAKVGVDSPPQESLNQTDYDGLPGENGYKYGRAMNGATISKINALFAKDFDLFEYRRLPE